MFCRKCGKMIQEDDLFCSQCGTTIVETSACALNTSDSEGAWLQKAGNLQQESSSRSDALIPSLDVFIKTSIFISVMEYIHLKPTYPEKALCESR